jgi:hypothetical protein
MAVQPSGAAFLGPFAQMAIPQPTQPLPGMQPTQPLPGMTGTEAGFGPNNVPRGAAGDLLITPMVAARLPKAPGLVVPGTLDPYNRVKVLRPGGGYETMLTRGIELDGGRIAIIPSVVGGRELTREQAIEHFHRTHEHFGIFDSREAADAYDKALHDQIEPGSYERKSQPQPSVGPFTRAGY